MKLKSQWLVIQPLNQILQLDIIVLIFHQTINFVCAFGFGPWWNYSFAIDISIHKIRPVFFLLVRSDLKTGLKNSNQIRLVLKLHIVSFNKPMDILITFLMAILSRRLLFLCWIWFAHAKRNSLDVRTLTTVDTARDNPISRLLDVRVYIAHIDDNSMNVQTHES